MEPLPPVTHLLIIENDAEVARAIATLAMDVLAHEPQLIVGAARTGKAACDLVRRAAGGASDRLIVACSARLEDESGLAVLDYVERERPDARVILLTDGERGDVLRGLERRVDGIVQKPVALPELRAILQHLASDEARRQAWTAQARAAAPSGLRHALDALTTALEAVESAHDHLRRSGGGDLDELRRHLADAERHALLAHRRVLVVERGLAPAAEARRGA